MLSKTNFAKAKENLLKYLEAGDYSKPFILAGWTGIGKTALINQVKNETDMDFEVFAYNSDVDKKEKDILNHVQSHAEVARVFEITITTGHELRYILQAGFDVNLQEVDFDEWVEWASQVNKETGWQNIPDHILNFIRQTGNLSVLHSGYKNLANIEEKIDENLQKVAAYEGDDIAELRELVNTCVKLITYRYISQEDAQNSTDKLLDVLKQQMEAKPKMGPGIFRMVRELAELFSTCLF